MKTIFATRSTPWLLAASAATAMLFSGCATQGEHSFNHDFGENLPAEPVYSIQNEDDQHFILRVHQGVPLSSAARTVNVKEAASTVAKAEAERLGWKKWQLNYIQEKDDGWMHVVVARVDRETYVEPTFPETKSNP